MNAEALRRMRDMGLSLDQIIELAEAMDTHQPRSNNAERQARFRAKRAAKSVTSNVTDNVTKSVTEASSRVRDITPSLVLSGKKEDTQEANASFVAQKRYANRRCPTGWLPSLAVLATADSEGFSSGEIERELAKFKDHQFRDARSDWDATFRNWLRTANDRRPKPTSQKFQARQDNLARSFAGAEAAGRYLDGRKNGPGGAS